MSGFENFVTVSTEISFDFSLFHSIVIALVSFLVSNVSMQLQVTFAPVVKGFYFNAEDRVIRPSKTKIPFDSNKTHFRINHTMVPPFRKCITPHVVESQNNFLT
jgi:hypothetical protein